MSNSQMSPSPLINASDTIILKYSSIQFINSMFSLTFDTGLDWYWYALSSSFNSNQLFITLNFYFIVFGFLIDSNSSYKCRIWVSLNSRLLM